MESTSIGLRQFGSVVQFLNLINAPSESNIWSLMDWWIIKKVMVTLVILVDKKIWEILYYNSQWIYLQDSRTQESESGKVQKLLINGEDGSVFITGLTGKVSGVFQIFGSTVKLQLLKQVKDYLDWLLLE